MENNNKRFSSVLLFLSILFCFVSVWFCAFTKNNSSLDSSIFFAIIKGIPMLLVIWLASVESKNVGYVTNYRKNIIIALIFSLFGDIFIVFNFIMGGVSFLMASVFFVFAFFNHYSFSGMLVSKKNDDFKRQLLIGVIISFVFFFLFILYAIIFVYPFLNHDLIIFKVLFPIYILFLSIAIGSSFFGKVPNIIKFAMILFFFSDVILFYNFSFNFPLITVVLNLSFYYLSQNIFAKNIDE